MPENSFLSRIGSAIAAMARRDRRRVSALPRFGRGRLRRWSSRVTLLGLLGTLGGFAIDMWGMQEKACSVPLVQPFASDACGALGLGKKPPRAERLVWESLPPGDCKALDDFVRRYPASSKIQEAEDRLDHHRTPRETKESDFTRDGVSLDYVNQAERPISTRSAAVAKARELAETQAAFEQCAPGDPSERLVRVELIEFVPRCREIAGVGVMCGADYRPRCHMRGKRPVEWCGPGGPE